MQWAFYVDGKDAQKGPNASAWDGFDRIPKALKYIWEDDFSSSQQEGLPMSELNKIHKLCCDGYDFRPYRQIESNPFVARCHSKLGCSTRQDLMGDVPGELTAGFRAHMGKCKAGSEGGAEEREYPELHDQTSEVDVDHASEKSQNEAKLKRLIADYNSKIATADTEESKMDVLTKFLRAFAWAHFWQNNNGRMRTLLLQREIRRLGLGCGALMFNYNRDVFVINVATYKRKIQEGIAKYDEMMRDRQNPWTVKANRERHLHEFALPPEIRSHGDCMYDDKKKHDGNVLAGRKLKSRTQEHLLEKEVI